MRISHFIVAAGLLAMESGVAGPLDFMTGHWRSTEGTEVSEEIWTDGAGGLFLGVNRTLVDGRARSFEYLRIVVGEAGYARYCAQPGGQAGTCFALVETGDHHVVFENPDHDFPQRIRYERSGESLTATVSDLAGEQSFRFAWTRVDQKE